MGYFTSLKKKRPSKATYNQRYKATKASMQRRFKTVYTHRRRGPPASQSAHVPDMKAIDVGSTTTTGGAGGVPLDLNNVASVVPLNLVAAGSSYFNRIGRKIAMESISFEGQISFINNVGTALPDVGRIAIVYDRQPNGALPIFTDIFADQQAFGSPTSSTVAGLNLNNRDRFTLLLDKKFLLPAVTTTVNFGAAAGSMQPSSFSDKLVNNGYVREFRKLPALLTQFKADSATPVIGDIASGSLILVTIGTIASGSEGYYINDWRCRLRYHDC